MRREHDVGAVRRPGRAEPRPDARPGAPGAEPHALPGSFDRRELPLLRILDEDGVADGEVQLDDEVVGRLYRWMLFSRALDERMVTLQRQGRIGFYIGAVGEEASVVGAAAGMADGDWIFPCYREHVVSLMRGLPLVSFLDDLFGNAGDLVKGRQMPCHESWRPGHFTSISSPIGTQLTHAVGAAWAARLKREEMVSLTYLGEGATSAHDFHTAMNFAGVHRVPVVFLCRNNGWAISVPVSRQTASETIAQKAIAYGMRGERVDGNDLLAVEAATRRARARAAAGEGPTLLECVTYRMEGHSTSDDPRAYRPAELVEPWRRKDPLARVRRYLARRGALGDAADAALQAEVREAILAALRESEAKPAKPPLASLFEDVYAEPLWQQREQRAELEAAVAADPRVADPRHSDP
jgi:2-oxoisovalerate dehydrogenase E1 component alpha subunit